MVLLYMALHIREPNRQKSDELIMHNANNAMLGCMFVTYTDICKDIMFTVQADHHGTSIRFHFHVHLKPLYQQTLFTQPKMLTPNISIQQNDIFWFGNSTPNGVFAIYIYFSKPSRNFIDQALELDINLRGIWKTSCYAINQTGFRQIFFLLIFFVGLPQFFKSGFVFILC